MVRIGPERAADDLRIRPGAPSLGMVRSLQDQHRRPLADEEPGTAPIEWSDGGRGVVTRLEPRQRLHAPKGCQQNGFQRGIRRPGQDHVAGATADQLGPLEHRDEPGGARRDRRQARPPRPDHRATAVAPTFGQHIPSQRR